MIDMPGFILFSLIFMRMTGFISLNPVLGRRNIPTTVRGGFIMILAVNIFMFSQAQGIYIDIPNSFEYGILLLKEFAIGFVLGFVMELFYFVIMYAGAIIDFDIGMSMATVYDPQSRISMPISSSILNVFMMLLFFAMDGHLVLLRILIQSGNIVPYAEVAFSPQTPGLMLDIFKECVELAVKFSFPIMGMELLMEVGVGILMKMIPQINVFVINIQAKILLGLILLLIFVSPMADFIERLVIQMLEAVKQILTFF